MTYAQRVDARRRLMILQLMVQDGGRGNDGTLLTGLRELGERVELDQATVRRLLRELEARDCLTTDMVRDVVMVAQITERGRMAVAGDTAVDGVDSPFQGL